MSLSLNRGIAGATRRAGTGSSEQEVCQRVTSLSSAACFGLCEPAASEFFLGDRGEVRLDVQNRSAVQHVNATNEKASAFSPDKLNYGEPYRVGPIRRSRG